VLLPLATSASFRQSPQPMRVKIAATEYKPICMQNGGKPSGSESGGVFWALVPEFQNQDPQSEDCLYLNIWGPKKSIGKGRRPKHQKKVPVIIWSE
jgi:carboxylesterase type B